MTCMCIVFVRGEFSDKRRTHTHTHTQTHCMYEQQLSRSTRKNLRINLISSSYPFSLDLFYRRFILFCYSFFLQSVPVYPTMTAVGQMDFFRTPYVSRTQQPLQRIGHFQSKEIPGFHTLTILLQNRFYENVF